MNRSTSLTFIVLFIVGGLNYAIKQKVIHHESTIIELKKNLHKIDANLHLLQAEWAYLNRPERLQVLSEKYTALDFNPQVDFVSFTDLEPIIDNTPRPFEKELTIDHLILLTNAETD